MHSVVKQRENTERKRTFRQILLMICCIVLLCVFLFPVRISAADAKEDTATEKIVKIGWYQSDLFQEGMSDDAPKSGYCYEYIHKVADYNGWTYEYIYGDWTELYEKLLNGEIDVLAGVSKTEERMDKILYPDEVMGYEHYVLYQHAGGDMDAAGLTGFDGKKIGAITDNLMTDYLEKWIAKTGVGAEIVYYDSFGERDEDFADGKIDGLVTTNNGVLSSSGYAQVAEVGKESYYLAVTKSREDLLEDLNRALSYMQDLEPYFITNLEYESYGTTLANSSLSAPEEEWLSQHSTLTVGCLENYLPYSGTDNSGAPCGLVTDVLTAMFAELDIEDRLFVTYRFYSSDDEVLAALKNGEVDAAFPVSGATWQLEQDGIGGTNNVVTAAVDLVYKGTYSEEKLSRIAVPGKSRTAQSYAAQQFPDAEIAEYETIEECLNAVLKGKADATIIDGLRADLVKQNRAYSSLSLKQLEKTNGSCFGVVKENVGLQMLLNRGIRLIGSNFGSNAACNYMSYLYKTTIADFVFDNLGLFAALAGLLILLIAEIGVREHKKDRKYLRLEEEKNKELTVLTEKQNAQLKEITSLNGQLEAEKEEREKAVISAEAANRAKSKFLFNMSHDIRTPMNAILGFTELLKKHKSEPEKLDDYIGKIESSSRFLLSLINNVLEMARIESGNTALQEEAQSIAKFNESLFSVFDEQMGKKQIRFTRSIDVQHGYIYCDPVKMREIFLNILSNAYKYTPEGGSVVMTVKELPSDRENYGKYRTTITDTGIGMSAEYLPHIFEEFSREKSVTDSKIEGTGLGMPIVKQLVELMGGTIEVESEQGKGSTFTVTLSHRIAEESSLEEVKSPPVRSEEFKGKRILLAEDNDLNAEIAVEILTDAGFTVDRAEDGNICVAMLQNRETGYYDVILMDIQMPNCSGYEATRKIRALEDAGKAGIPILAMTANAFETDKQNALDAGMNGHLAKPIDVAVLMKTLKENLY